MKKGRFSKKSIILIISLLFVVILEIVLRVKYGFCDSVLMQESSNYEYIAQPNQNRFRFGKHIEYNEYSMRSESVDTSSTIILGFGDSVINGGTLTDQDSLATTLLTDSLSTNESKKYQVLNISAGSWGPDNCANYLLEHGDFNAKVAFLVASSHDAFDNMEFQKLVGIDPSYPDEQYKLAIWELFDRYLIPRAKAFFINENGENLGINKNGSTFNKGFSLLNDYFKKNDIPFFVYLHSELGEQENARYSEQGQLVIDFCKKNNIPIIGDLNKMQGSDYRDNIHLSEQGQKKMYKILLEELKKATLVQ